MTDVPVHLQDEIRIKILNLGSNGEGIGRVADFTVFVPGALPGELVLARITLVKKNYAVGRLLEILERSGERAEPLCPVYDRCGGCQLQHLAYEAQLRYKRQTVENALQRLGHLTVPVLPVLGADSPWNYRNKMQFPVSGSGEKLALGCYAIQSHRVIDTPECLIQAAANNRILTAVRAWMQQYHVPAYDERTGRGVVRHIMGRVATQVLAVLVTKNEKLPHAEELVAFLRQGVPDLVGVVQNINPERTNVIMGKHNKLLWGLTTVREQLGPLHFNISPLSFFQVNTRQAERLYATALDFAGLQGRETVVDVYCGTGTISLYMAQRAHKVYGIEIVAPAIADAKQNATENHLTNAEFICGDAAVELPKLLKQGVQPDVITVDPPRAGCDEKVLTAMAKVQPRRIVYVSCNPATLARDLAILNNKGYKIEKVQPVDMFPMTMHVESVALLVRE